MKWIKASERLPEVNIGAVYLKGCRVDKGVLTRVYVTTQKAYFIELHYDEGFGLERLSSWRDGNDELENIFWLDESIEEQPGEKDAISFAEWIYQNDIGQNMHGWFIRNPDKAGTFYTTTELYNIYKNANP